MSLGEAMQRRGLIEGLPLAAGACAAATAKNIPHCQFRQAVMADKQALYVALKPTCECPHGSEP